MPAHDTLTAPLTHSAAAILPGPAALRELARAFAHVGDFKRFVTGLETALSRAEFFTETRVQLFPATHEADSFRTGHLALPLAGADQIHGSLQVSGLAEARAFGPEDLHLMSSLAAVLAAALDHAVRHGEQRRNLEILSVLLDLAPVGLIALQADGRVVLANETARRWLGVACAEAAAEKLTPENLGANWRTEPRFHLRLDGKLIYGEARQSAEATAFVLADLTAQQAQLMDGLQRELYRCRWLGLKLSFVLLGAHNVVGGLLQRLPEIRTHLQPGEFIGPYDAHRIGLVLPGLDPGAALHRLRTLATRLPTANLEAAVISAENVSASEHVLAAALTAMRPAAAALRPSLLLHDDYAAVNDMIALVLARDFEIVKSTRYADAVAHLRARPFDALVTEVDLREGGSGLDLARLAKQLQPSLRPIFTTVAHHVPAAAADPLLAGHLIIRKPFDATRLEASVTTALAVPLPGPTARPVG
jgi:PAS domain-containing protein